MEVKDNDTAESKNAPFAVAIHRHKQSPFLEHIRRKLRSGYTLNVTELARLHLTVIIC